MGTPCTWCGTWIPLPGNQDRSEADEAKISRLSDKTEAGSQCEVDKNDAHVQTSIETTDQEVQANEFQIKKEVVLMRTDPDIVSAWKSRTTSHQERYPGGTLPTELRSIEAFKQDRLSMLSSLERRQEQERSRCVMCGVIPEST